MARLRTFLRKYQQIVFYSNYDNTIGKSLHSWLKYKIQTSKQQGNDDIILGILAMVIHGFIIVQA